MTKKEGEYLKYGIIPSLNNEHLICVQYVSEISQMKTRNT